MKYGAMNFPVRPVLDEIHAIAELGFDYLELAMDPPLAHYSQVLAEKTAIVHALDASGMGLVCHLPTFVHTADLTELIRAASLAETLHSLDAAAELGAEKAVVHPGLISGLGVHVIKMARGYALESLEAIHARAHALGIRLCLENMFPRYLGFVAPEDFADVFRRMPALGLTLDTGHAHIGDPDGGRLMGFVAAYGDRIGHVHVSDNKGRGDDHSPLGDGTIDFERWVRALLATGYQDTVTFEIFSPDPGDLVRSRQAFDAMVAAT
jgi:sugar phosphate isomerase/epimerase